MSEGEKTAEELVTLLRKENAAQQTENAAQQTGNAAQRELVALLRQENAAQQTENAILRQELELAKLRR